MGLYYDYLYKAYWFTIGAPFLLAIFVFYGVYIHNYRKKTSRSRTKEMLIG